MAKKKLDAQNTETQTQSTPNVYSGKVADLRFDDKNFNKHTKRGKEMLLHSISTNGFGRSVLVDKDNRLIAGNGVAETAGGDAKTVIVEVTGDELVVVKRTDLTLDSKKGREMALADNVVGAVDLDLDEDMMRAAGMDLDIDFDSYGIDLPDLDDDTEEGTHRTTYTKTEEDDYDEDKDVAPRKAHTGDLWLLGSHRLVCGDSTDAGVVSRLFDANEHADLLLTDPPYNVAYKGTISKERLAIANDSMSSDAFFAFLTNAFSAADPMMRPGAALYIWYSLSEHTNFNTAAEAVGWKVSEHLIWVKNHFNFARHDYHYRHEPCIYGWKQGAAHDWYSDRCQSTVLEFDRPAKSVDHPTMKPVPLFAYQMENSSKEGDIVLDIFGGSGTTLIAAEKLGRSARLCELEPHYVNIILDRYIQLKGTSSDVYLVKDGQKIPYDMVDEII